MLQEWHFFRTQLNSFEFKGSPALRNLYKTEEKMLFAPISSGFVFIYSSFKDFRNQKLQVSPMIITFVG